MIAPLAIFGYVFVTGIVGFAVGVRAATLYARRQRWRIVEMVWAEATKRFRRESLAAWGQRNVKLRFPRPDSVWNDDFVAQLIQALNDAGYSAETVIDSAGSCEDYAWLVISW